MFLSFKTSQAKGGKCQLEKKTHMAKYYKISIATILYTISITPVLVPL